jgi:transcriptional regulator of heat shock response
MYYRLDSTLYHSLERLLMLSGRRQKVLNALVDEYVAHAVPVGSATLAQHYTLGVSPATVRNELMALEGDGYVVSPHVSSGRIPTNAGYRIYVNTLLLGDSVPASLSPWTAFASDSTPGGKLPHVSIERPEAIDELSQYLAQITDCLAVVWMPQISETVFHKGMPTLLAQPEFHDVLLLIPLLQMLESKAELARLLETTFQSNGLQIMIGSENHDRQLAAFSMVAACFGHNRQRGVVALFGPTRMDYRKAIRAVHTTSTTLGNLFY